MITLLPGSRLEATGALGLPPVLPLVAPPATDSIVPHVCSPVLQTTLLTPGEPLGPRLADRLLAAVGTLPLHNTHEEIATQGGVHHRSVMPGRQCCQRGQRIGLRHPPQAGLARLNVLHQHTVQRSELDPDGTPTLSADTLRSVGHQRKMPLASSCRVMSPPFVDTSFVST